MRPNNVRWTAAARADRKLAQRERLLVGQWSHDSVHSGLRWSFLPRCALEDDVTESARDRAIHRRNLSRVRIARSELNWTSRHRPLSTVGIGLRRAHAVQRHVTLTCFVQATVLIVLYDLMIMYVGLFGHSAVVFHVFYVSHVFYVLLTVCVVVFFQWHFIDLFSCITASLFKKNLLTYCLATDSGNLVV